MAQIRTTHSINEEVLKEVSKVMANDSRPSVSNTIEMLLKEAIAARKKKKVKA